MSMFWFAIAFAKQGGYSKIEGSWRKVLKTWWLMRFFSITNIFDIITLGYKYNGVANPDPHVAVRLVFCHRNNAWKILRRVSTRETTLSYY